MQQPIEKVLETIIKQKFWVSMSTFRLETPPKKEMGDIAFPCFQLAKDTKLAPPVIAWELKAYIDEHKSELSEIERVEVAGPYINITLNKGIYTKQFQDTFTGFLQSQEAIHTFPKKEELIIVDYIGANVGKPLHIGHMCTPNIGQSLINLYKKLGYNVIGDSHIGDWGIIFGKLILAYKLWGDEGKLKENAIDYLLELYIKVSEEAEKNAEIEQQTRDEFKLLSEGNSESVKLWESITRQSIDFMQVQLSRLNVHPTYNIGESFYEGLSIPKMGEYPDLKYPMKVIVEELIKKGIAIRNEDESAGVEFEKMPSTILQKRDGTHGYLASDLATIKYRTTTWKSIKKIVYSVDVRQELHLQQVYDIARRAGWVEGIELFHASNGFISLKDGAMSTRTGKIIRLETLLDEAEDRAKKIILEKRDDITWDELTTLAKTIGIGAIKYGYLSKSRTTNVVFDWDEFMTFEGNSGPYIQYAYVRGKSILENLVYTSWSNKAIFETPEEIELVKALLSYPQILEETAQKNLPHILAGYSYDLTKLFNSFYNAVNIKNEPSEDKKQLRLWLVKVFCETLKDSFSILGIDMPEKM